MFLSLWLVLVPADDGAVGALYDGLGRLVGPLRGEHEDLAGLLHVLLVQLRQDSKNGDLNNGKFVRWISGLNGSKLVF